MGGKRREKFEWLLNRSTLLYIILNSISIGLGTEEAGHLNTSHWTVEYWDGHFYLFLTSRYDNVPQKTTQLFIPFKCPCTDRWCKNQLFSPSNFCVLIINNKQNACSLSSHVNTCTKRLPSTAGITRSMTLSVVKSRYSEIYANWKMFQLGALTIVTKPIQKKTLLLNHLWATFKSVEVKH